MTIRSLKQANLALQPYVPLVAQLTGKDTTLKRIKPLMKLLDNPQDKLRVIHIAGTSGKTSTAYYMSALLSYTGKKIGLTVSPHVDSILERVQINTEPLPEQTFCQELGQFLDIIQKTSEPPSYFELLYAFSLWVFVRQNVDYAVIETGMGGLYDATNVITRPDKICVITDIGLDHTHILGKTVEQIAAQKIGIVHDHNQVFTYIQSESVMTVFQNWINAHQAVLNTTTQAEQREISELDFSGIANYQERNWLMAHWVYQYLIKCDHLPSLTSKVLSQSLHTKIPARMDVWHIDGKTIVMDGAHNLQKMSALLASFKELYPGVKPAVMIALKHDKDYQDIADKLSVVASRVIVTTFKSSQDLPVKSMDPHVLAKAISGVPIKVITDPLDATRELLSSPESVGLITGSFYLLSQIRNNKNLL